MCHYVGFRFAACRGKHTDAAGKVVIDFHKTDSNQAVEPSVGDFLYNRFIGGLVITFLLAILNVFGKMITFGNIFVRDLRGLACPHIIELELI